MRTGLSRAITNPAVILGLAVIIFAIAWFREMAAFHRRAILAESEIISVDPIRSRGSAGVFLNYVYQDANGRKWQGSAGYSGQPITVGQRIGVLYDPLQPGRSEIEGGWLKWIRPSLLLILGAIVAVVSWGKLHRTKPIPPPLPTD